MQWATKSEFARICDVSPAYITQLVKRGRLDPALSTDRRLIEVKAGKKIMASMDKRKSPKAKSQKRIDKSKSAAPSTLANLEKAGVDVAGMTFDEARIQNEILKAKLQQLEYDQKNGQLIDKSEVEKAAFELGRHVRDSILQIPDRIGAILAAERDEFKVKQELLKELRQAMEALSDGR